MNTSDNMTEEHQTDFQPDWYEGGCHCGSVRFAVFIHEPIAIVCNCSICARKGFINLIAKAEDFRLLQGEEELQTYRFNTGVAQHRFCRNCGIHPFSRPRSHPGGYDVNARCLDAGPGFLSLSEFDGQNWEQSVASIR